MPLKTKHDWILAVGTAVVSILGTLGVMRSDLLEFRASQLELAYARIAALELRLDRFEDELDKKDAQIAQLTAQLSQKPDPTAALFRYIESIRQPAWVKVYDPQDQSFRMMYINRRYEFVYNVTRAKYIGSTDFEIHPLDVARHYYDNDKNILENRSFNSFIEDSFIVDPKTGTKSFGKSRFWKFYVKLDDGRELITGIQLGPAEEYIR